MNGLERNCVENLCMFLADKERLCLFDLLYDAAGKRKVEEIHTSSFGNEIPGCVPLSA